MRPYDEQGPESYIAQLFYSTTFHTVLVSKLLYWNSRHIITEVFYPS